MAVRAWLADLAVDRGVTRFHGGDLDGAIDAFRAAVAIRPAKGYAHSMLVTALGRAKRTTDAVAACRAWTTALPDDAGAWLTRAQQELAASRLPDARGSLTRVRELAPSSPAWQAAIDKFEAKLSRAEGRLYAV